MAPAFGGAAVPYRPPPRPHVDPRDRVTDAAFQIAPAVLGVELATPARRAAALGVDLLLAAVVANVGGGAVAGLVAATLFVLVAMRRGRRTRFRRVVRGALVGVGAVILFGVAVGVVEGSDDEPESAEDRVAEAFAEANRGRLAAGLAPLTLDDDRPARPDALTGAERAAAAADLRAYADALAARDSAQADSLRRALRPLVAGAELRRQSDRVDALRDGLRELGDENERLREDLDRPSYLRVARTVGTDVGLSIGWVGVYFTLTLAVWGGYTPGKRLAGVRVVRLDGERVSLWTAFERFGGYAAGLATGLVGFAQVLWDPNRQGIQDKVAATVVVRMEAPDTPRRAPAAPPPAAGGEAGGPAGL